MSPIPFLAQGALAAACGVPSAANPYAIWLPWHALQWANGHSAMLTVIRGQTLRAPNLIMLQGGKPEIA